MINPMKKFVLLIILYYSSLPAQSTWMMTNRVHPELKWSTISTKHFNIHYHQGIEEIAKEGAIIAEYVRPTLLAQMDLDTIFFGLNEDGSRTLPVGQLSEQPYYKNEAQVYAFYYISDYIDAREVTDKNFDLLTNVQFDQFINLRPVKLFEGVNAPLANKKPGDIDMLIVRENTEGEYSSVGGRMYKNTDREIAIQETIMSAHGVDRVQKFAFELAKQRKRKKLTNATKSNGISITMPFWDERFNKMKKNYPEIKTDQFHIDILVARFVLNPEWFDVVVASNLFGDILSDLGPACTGTIGIAPSGNINPENKFPSLFEPVHGSAPDIAGKGIANPIATILSFAMALRYSLDLDKEASALEQAVQNVLDEGLRTKDILSKGMKEVSTSEMGDAVISKLQ